jgi:hypothetical protein
VNPARRSILRFGLAFLLLFPLCLWLYAGVAAHYRAGVLRAVNLVLERREPPVRIAEGDDGVWRTSTRPWGELPVELPLYQVEPGSLHLLFVNLALLPALLLATPVSLGRRLRLLALGLGLAYVCHVATVLGLASVPEGGDSRLGRALLRRLLETGGQSAGFLQWGILTWRIWLDRMQGGGPA